MDSGILLVLNGFIVGVGATALLDLFTIFQRKMFSIPSPNWCFVGRWISYLPKGRFTHQNISKTPSIKGECLIGWTAHYVIGIVYGIILFLLMGTDWARHPSLFPALIFGLVTIIFPFFFMQPGLGMGIAASKTPNPNQARLRSLLNHCIFGIGLYLCALIFAK